MVVIVSSIGLGHLDLVTLLINRLGLMLLRKQVLRHLGHVAASRSLLMEGVTLDDARAARHSLMTWRCSLVPGTEALHHGRFLDG